MTKPARNYPKVDIAKVIRKGRIKKGLNQKELADVMEIRPSLISKWEHGHQTPRGDYLIRLANVLDIVPDLFPNQKNNSAQVPLSKIQQEIEDLWKAIRKKDEEEADLKKILLLLLKEKLTLSDSK